MWGGVFFSSCLLVILNTSSVWVGISFPDYGKSSVLTLLKMFSMTLEGDSITHKFGLFQVL